VFLLRAFSSVTGLVLFASRIACLIVIAWFVVFAVGQSSRAATQQSNEVATATKGAVKVQTPVVHESSARKTLDSAEEVVTKPFASLTSGVGNAWLLHGEVTLLTLLIYGLGFGFVARLVRVRV